MPAKPTIYLESTSVPVTTTVAEISAVLIKARANKIITEYAGDGSSNVTAISFSLLIGGAELPFLLPAKVEGVFGLLSGRRKSSLDRNKYREKDMQQARRTAWRLVLAWVKAQLALIEVDMAKAEQVFMPYLYNPATGQTLFDIAQERGMGRMLPAPENCEA